jgi:uncharacterized membrane protein YebE (DUF533 family)
MELDRLFATPHPRKRPWGHRLSGGCIGCLVLLRGQAVRGWLETVAGARISPGQPTPGAIAAMMVVSREGRYGLVTNAENLTCIAAASYLAIKGLRHYRQVNPPKRRPQADTPASRCLARKEICAG